MFGTVEVDCKSNLYRMSQSVADKYIVGFFFTQLKLFGILY